MVDRAQTEFVSFAMAREREDAYGELPNPAMWKAIEPDSISDYGNEYVRERRDPFNVDRLMRQQKLTGISAMASWEGDATDDHLELLVPLLLLAKWQNEWPKVTITATTANKITTTSPTRSIADGDIIYIKTDIATSSGVIVIPAGTYVMSGVSGATASLQKLEWTQTGRVKINPALPIVANTFTNRIVDVIGWEFTGSTATTLNNSMISHGSINFNQITESQAIYIAVGDTTTNSDIVDLAGMARVTGSSTGQINFERPGKDTGATRTTTSSDRIYLLDSRWIKNVNADDPKWDVTSYSMAAKYANVSAEGVSTGDSYETVSGLNLSSLSIRFSQQARVRLSVDFMGQIKRTTATLAGFDTATRPTSVNAISTSVDIGEARLINVTGNKDLATLLSSVDLNLSNNLSGDYYIDRLASRGPQIGKFDLSASIMAALASREMLEATENEQDGSFIISAGTEEGWWVFDVPRLTLNTDRRQFDRNQTLRLEYSTDYFPHRTSAATGSNTVALAVSRFPWLPSTD